MAYPDTNKFAVDLQCGCKVSWKSGYFFDDEHLGFVCQDCWKEWLLEELVQVSKDDPVCHNGKTYLSPVLKEGPRFQVTTPRQKIKPDYVADSLDRGDHVMWHNSLPYWHHAIVEEFDGTIVTLIEFNSEGIVRSKENVNKKGAHLYLVEYTEEVRDFNPVELVLARAKTLLGLKGYLLLERNWEDFATFCKTGVGVNSNQQKKWFTKRMIDIPKDIGVKNDKRSITNFVLDFLAIVPRIIPGMGIFLLLIMPVEVLMEENVHLNITDFSPSEVQLSCRYKLQGNVTGITFSVFKGSSTCLERYGDSSVNYNCGFDLLESEDPKTLRFAVPLDKNCSQRINVRCRISNTNSWSILDSSDYIELTAQSDPPIISVNKGQPVEVSFDPVQITCKMTNICEETKLDVFGEVPAQVVRTMHTKDGNRFNTTAISQAIFSQPGNYTITCKDVKKEDTHIYSRSYNVMVLPSQKVSYPKNDTKDSESFEVFKVSFIVVSVLTFAVPVTLVIACIRSNRKGNQKEDQIPKKSSLPAAMCWRHII